MYIYLCGGCQPLLQSLITLFAGVSRRGQITCIGIQLSQLWPYFLVCYSVISKVVVIAEKCLFASLFALLLTFATGQQLQSFHLPFRLLTLLFQDKIFPCLNHLSIGSALSRTLLPTVFVKSNIALEKCSELLSGLTVMTIVLHSVSQPLR